MLCGWNEAVALCWQWLDLIAKEVLVALNQLRPGVAKGELETSLEEHAGAYMAYAASIGEAEFVAEELPLGGVLVSEAPTEDILRLRGVAAVRLVTLQALHNALSTKTTAALQQMILSLA